MGTGLSVKKHPVVKGSALILSNPYPTRVRVKPNFRVVFGVGVIFSLNVGTNTEIYCLTMTISNIRIGPLTHKPNNCLLCYWLSA